MAEETAPGTKAPRVTIGLPVYNGERYLAYAIDSILSQTFTDFELLIGDNASTDRTPEICAEYARRDPRVRHIRHATNLGAGPNYDHLWYAARGEYFKWNAHDDGVLPQFLEKTVAALDAHPEAVLAAVGILEIDGEGKELRRYANPLPDCDSPDPAKRFSAIINVRHQCEDFFGLWRRQAMVGSQLHDSFTGSDRTFLAEMALRGPWVKVPEVLFIHREHDNRYTRSVLLKNRDKAESWQNTVKPVKGSSTYFHLVIYKHFWNLVTKTIPPGATRMRCRWELMRWWWADNHMRGVASDILRGMSPELLERVRKVKHALVGVSEEKGPGSLPKM